MKSKTRTRAKLFSPKRLFYDFTKLTAFIPGLIWLRPKYIYESDAAKKKLCGGALVIANHSTFLDPVYLMAAVWYRRHSFVCLKQFFEGGAGWLFKLFGCIPVDTESFGFNSFRQIVEKLKAGEVVSLFPEGHVSQDGDVKAFKSGVVLMAFQGKAPILPVYIKPPKHFYNRLTVVIGERVDLTELYGEKPGFSQIQQAAESLKEKEEALKALT